MKVCPRCGKSRKRASYHRDASRADGLQPVCKFCRQRSRKPTPEYHRRYYRENHRFTLIERQFGLARDDVIRILRKQKNRCLICSIDFGSSWHIDHDHETGEFRGILCGPCNRGLGQLRDNIAILRRAIKYLEASKKGKKK